MTQPPTKTTIPYTRFPYPALFRSAAPAGFEAFVCHHRLFAVKQERHHVARDRIGGARPAAMLDHHRSGIARRVERREGDEKAVVAIFPGAALAAALAQADDLRGAGLARHLDILYRQSPPPGGARPVADPVGRAAGSGGGVQSG